MKLSEHYLLMLFSHFEKWLIDSHVKAEMLVCMLYAVFLQLWSRLYKIALYAYFAAYETGLTSFCHSNTV